MATAAHSEFFDMIRRNRSYIALTFAVIVVVAAAAFFWGGPRPTGSKAAAPIAPVDAAAESDIARVNTLHPKKDPHFAISIQQLTWVRPYYQANIKSRVPGVVRQVPHVIGDTVKKGELLVEIDVPDLLKDVAEKNSIVAQRTQEFRMAQAKLKSAKAWIAAASAEVAQRRAGIVQADATTQYRKKRLDRYRELLKRQAINEDLVDEQEKDWMAAVGASQFALAALQKAEADLDEKKANLETGEVDVDLKKAQVQVAQHDLERGKALADYARITAPFDGAILKRNVDPGDFVQNAAGGSTEPLLVVARNDLVTMVSKVPDNAAPFISTKTPVEIQIDQIPGVIVKANLTRYSPSIDPSDRTMRVEVDFCNSDGPCYDNLTDGTKVRLTENMRPPELGNRQIVPGMNGYMRLRLDELAGARLVPSYAIFSRGGKPYVMLAEQGKAKLSPIVVQVNDGKLAKISLLKRDSSGREVPVDLTGHEEIIASRQAELDDGQAIQTNLKDW